MSPEAPPFHFERDGGRFSLHGELDLATVPDLEAPLLDAVREDEVVIDLSDLEFCDSSCIKLLVSAAELAKSAGRVLRIVRPKPDGEVAKIIAISGVEPAFEFVES